MIRFQKNRTRLKKLSDEDDDFVDASPAERLDIIWELTAELWSLRGQECAQKQRQIVEIEGLSVPILSLGDLVKNKRATGRDKDRLDADRLEKEGP